MKNSEPKLKWTSVDERVPKMGRINSANSLPRHYLMVSWGRIVYDVFRHDYERYGVTHWLDVKIPKAPEVSR